MKNNIGIWIDLREAKIVNLADAEEVVIIPSQLEEGNVKGGYGSSVKHLPQDSVSDTKKLERRKQQLAKYCDNVIDHVKTADSLYIFGPGEARTLLERELRDNTDLSQKVKAVEPGDIMTENQLVAKVKEFYSA